MHFDQALHLLQQLGPSMEQKGLRIATRFYDSLEATYEEELRALREAGAQYGSRELRILRLHQLLNQVTNQHESSELFKLILLNEIDQTKSFLLTYPDIISREILQAIQIEYAIEESSPLLQAWAIVHHQLVDTCRHFCKYRHTENWRQQDILLIAENHHLGSVIDEARHALLSGRKTTLLHVSAEELADRMLSNVLSLTTKGMILHQMQQEGWEQQMHEFLTMITVNDPIVFVSGSTNFIEEIQQRLDPLPVLFGPFVAANQLPS
ncbi:hypothetical protein ACRPK8_05990 [Exiguobacterium sp. TDN 0502]|uniref:hypothetical protein n=1 Tax=Exiguobacterium sp. TDN 0502 TaxID=3420731 RepID=UPI003D783E45